MDKYFLNDLEVSLVESFYNNETQREAVKKILLFGIYSNGVIKKGGKRDPSMNWALGLPWNVEGTTVSNEKLGADLRAIAEGIKSVELAFKELAKIKKPEAPKKKEPNPGK